MSWSKEVRKKLIDKGETIKEMAEAIDYNEDYIYNVLRDGNPTTRIRNVINRHVGLDEKKGAE